MVHLNGERVEVHQFLVFGSSGTGDGEFYYAYGLSIGLDGKIYIADKNNRIQVLTKTEVSSENLKLWNCSVGYYHEI